MRQSSSVVLLLLPVSLAGCGADSGTYAANCSAPPPNFGLMKDGVGHLVIPLSITISREGSLTWTGRAVSDDQLIDLAHAAGEFAIPPQLVLEVDPDAPCKRVRDIRTILLSSPICKPKWGCSEGRDPKSWPISGGP